VWSLWLSKLCGLDNQLIFALGTQRGEHCHSKPDGNQRRHNHNQQQQRGGRHVWQGAFSGGGKGAAGERVGEGETGGRPSTRPSPRRDPGNSWTSTAAEPSDPIGHRMGVACEEATTRRYLSSSGFTFIIFSKDVALGWGSVMGVKTLESLFTI